MARLHLHIWADVDVVSVNRFKDETLILKHMFMEFNACQILKLKLLVIQAMNVCFARAFSLLQSKYIYIYREN